jgi:hypothetical protein
MTDPTARAINIANRLRALNLPASQENIDTVMRTLDAESRGAVADAYGPGLAALRAAAEQRTPEATFEARYKADRLRALEAEWEKTR